jgi:hypothetical protein
LKIRDQGTKPKDNSKSLVKRVVSISLVPLFLLVVLTGCGGTKVEGDLYVGGNGKLVFPLAKTSVYFLPYDSKQELLEEIMALTEDRKTVHERRQRVVRGMCALGQAYLQSDSEVTRGLLNEIKANGNLPDDGCSTLGENLENQWNEIRPLRENYQTEINRLNQLIAEKELLREEMVVQTADELYRSAWSKVRIESFATDLGYPSSAGKDSNGRLIVPTTWTGRDTWNVTEIPNTEFLAHELKVTTVNDSGYGWLFTDPETDRAYALDSELQFVFELYSNNTRIGRAGKMTNFYCRSGLGCMHDNNARENVDSRVNNNRYLYYYDLLPPINRYTINDSDEVRWHQERLSGFERQVNEGRKDESSYTYAYLGGRDDLSVVGNLYPFYLERVVDGSGWLDEEAKKGNIKLTTQRVAGDLRYPDEFEDKRVPIITEIKFNESLKPVAYTYSRYDPDQQPIDWRKKAVELPQIVSLDREIVELKKQLPMIQQEIVVEPEFSPFYEADIAYRLCAQDQAKVDPLQKELNLISNTATQAQELCESDPSEAKEFVDFELKFGALLRGYDQEIDPFYILRDLNESEYVTSFMEILDSEETIKTVTDGKGGFEVKDVPSGRYVVFAGTEAAPPKGFTWWKEVEFEESEESLDLGESDGVGGAVLANLVNFANGLIGLSAEDSLENSPIESLDYNEVLRDPETLLYKHINEDIEGIEKEVDEWTPSG